MTISNFKLRQARRVAILLVGGTVVILGIVMLVLPGPGFLAILAGLGILGAEFALARYWLRRLKETGRDASRIIRKRDGRSIWEKLSSIVASLSRPRQSSRDQNGSE